MVMPYCILFYECVCVYFVCLMLFLFNKKSTNYKTVKDKITAHEAIVINTKLFLCEVFSMNVNVCNFNTQ